MATKTITAYVAGTDKKYGVQAVCTSTANIAENTSTLTVKVRTIHPYINISSRSGKIKIGTTKYSYNASAIKASGPTLVTSKTVTIPHNDDGTKQLDVAVSFPFDLDSSNYGDVGNAVASGTMTLDVIPRTSVIESATGSVIVNGINAWSVKMQKFADAFRHKATLTFGSKSITTEVFDTTASIVIPLDWLNLIPTQNESIVDVSIQTYSDDTCTTEIGSPAVTTFTIKVPNDSAPRIMAGWASISVYNTGTPANGMSVYVQGYSRAKATFNTSLIVPKGGATVEKLEISWNGISGETLSPVITGSGRQIVRCAVTDSRGMQSSEDFAITVQAYYLPTLSDISLFRCDAYGNAQDDGTMLYFKANCQYAPCGGQNTISIVAQWKPVSNASWGNTAQLTNGVGSVLGSGSINAVSSYNARIMATDRLGNVISYTALISTGNVALHLREGGKGGAFGKFAESDGLLDCAWDLLVRGDATVEGNIDAASAVFTGDIDANMVKGGSVAATGAVKGGSVQAENGVSAKSALISDGAAIGLTIGTNGTAVGMSSSGTSAAKKFEVAAGYESVFYGGIRGVTDYSNGEVATGGKWIDGKPVYRKAFTNSVVIVGNGTTSVPTGIDSVGVILRLEAFVEYAASIGPMNTFGRPADVSGYGTTIDLFDKTTNTLRVRRGSAYGSIAVGDAYFIMEYTKNG